MSMNGRRGIPKPASSVRPTAGTKQLAEPAGALQPTILTKQPKQPAPSSKSSFNTNTAQSTATGTKKDTVVAAAAEAEGVNIKVVVRVRGRSPKEIAENTPSIVTTSPEGSSLFIETSSAATSGGDLISNLNGPIAREYQFDNVFGPEADQELIFNEVVKEALDEVLMGFNCSIFCYGQTGTGKTHTMQGDLSANVMGRPNGEAGILPRVLHSLFSQLESPLSTTEYTVKASFLELYNEEIRDLLSPNVTNETGGLKVFEDLKAGKGCVVVQGLEESILPDAKAGLEILRQGSQRREVGATNMNSQSSRSHSVFSITVHIKDSAGGSTEDSLRVGKFNLIDLAGSENIGKSGAEKGRAREAGMINQSLLTLGRVINALVEKEKHIPYRESKLTRLLQDSLGGKTKTRIIATISPARNSMEETQSTLDYAARAGNITNKPELNLKLTKSALIKEYVNEINRLKADIHAAREKNGITVSQETWAELQLEKDLHRTKIDEAISREKALNTQMQKLKADLDESMTLILQKEGEVALSKVELQAAVDALIEKENHLQAVKAVADESVSDVAGLFKKITRKESLLLTNKEAVKSHGNFVEQGAASLAATLHQFRSDQDGIHTSLMKLITQQQRTSTASLDDGVSKLDSAAAVLAQSLTGLQGVWETSSKSWSTWALEVEQAGADIASTLDQAAELTTQNLENGVNTVLLTVQANLAMLAEISQSFDSKTTEFSDQVLSISQSQKASLTSFRQQVLKIALEESQRQSKALKINTTLETTRSAGLQQQLSFIEKQRQMHVSALKQLEDQESLIRAEADKLEREFSEMNTVENLRCEAMRSMSEMANNYLRVLEDGLSSLAGSSKHSLDTVEAVSQRTLEARGLVSKSVASELQAFQNKFAASCDKDMALVNTRIERIQSITSEAATQNTDLSHIYGECVDSVQSDVKASLKDVRQSIISTSSDLSSFYASSLSSVSASTSSVQTAMESSASNVTALISSYQSFAQNGIQDYVKTGSTPLKRTWKYPVGIPAPINAEGKDLFVELTESMSTSSLTTSPNSVSSVSRPESISSMADDELQETKKYQIPLQDENTQPERILQRTNSFSKLNSSTKKMKPILESSVGRAKEGVALSEHASNIPLNRSLSSRAGGGGGRKKV